MAEFLRMHVSRLHRALNEPEIAPFDDIHESDGRGRAGPAEALATFHQLVCDEWLSPLARVEVDERNCIAMVVWRAVREAAAHLLSKHAASASWKHRWISPKDKGAGQGDVDCLLSAARLWAWWRRRQMVQVEYNVWLRRALALRTGGSEAHRCA